MKSGELKAIIEGLLFAAGDEGLDVKQLSEVLEIPRDKTYDLISELRNDYIEQGRGIQLVEIAGAFQLTTLPEHAPYFQKLAQSPSRATLSQAALETLAIIAYRQPVTRIDIEEIRGVKSDRAIQTLQAKMLIEEVGRADAPGRPILYGTTKTFLDYFGLRSLDELPDAAGLESGQVPENEIRLLFGRQDRQLTIDDVGGHDGKD